jgi:predicted metal-binding protein
MNSSKGTSRALGKTSSSKALKSDLVRYRQIALDLGASGAAVIPASDVSVDERVRLKCLVPRCLRAGETPNCPPNAPSLDLVRKALSLYHWAILVKTDVKPISDYAPKKTGTKEEQRKTLLFHQKTSEIVNKLECQAYKDGYHLAMGLGGGSCKDYLCQGLVCQFLDSGRCRFPQRARPAMEAMGIDVTSLINKAGWDVYALVDNLDCIPCAISVGMVFIT